MNITRYRLFLVTVTLVLVILIVPAMGAMGPALGATDITGNNIRMVVVGTKEECSAACDAEPACVAATFVLPGTIQGPDGHCYFKSAANPRTENFNCYSFVKEAALPGGGCSMSHPRAYIGISNPPGSKKTDPAEIGSMAPLTLQFTDMSTGAQTWLWDFGDGSPVSSEQNPQHTFMTGSFKGTPFLVTLKVTGSCPGETDSLKTNVTVYDNMGALALASNPGGARVVVDGVNSLRTTDPQGKKLIFELVPGDHTVRLTLDGYTDYFNSVTITNGRIQSLAPSLEKITTVNTTTPSATGSLQITTTPDGASVSIDGGSGGTTPLTLSGLAAGSHTVTLTKTGYTDYHATVTVTSGQTTPLNVKLVAGTGPTSITTTTGVPTGTGSISVTSSPSGASVNLDGWDKGTTPVTIEQVKAGSHTLTLKKAGYEDAVRTVAVSGGAVVPVAVTLVPQGQQPSGANSTLTVRSTPDGASVYLDGGKIGTTPVTAQNVTAGTHKLLLTLPGYPDNSQTIEISSGSDKEMSVDFGPKMAPESAVPVLLAAGAFIALVVLIALVLWNKKKDC